MYLCSALLLYSHFFRLFFISIFGSLVFQSLLPSFSVHHLSFFSFYFFKSLRQQKQSSRMDKTILVLGLRLCLSLSFLGTSFIIFLLRPRKRYVLSPECRYLCTCYSWTVVTSILSTQDSCLLCARDQLTHTTRASCVGFVCVSVCLFTMSPARGRSLLYERLLCQKTRTHERVQCDRNAHRLYIVARL